jgi:hypothetical protein
MAGESTEDVPPAVRRAQSLITEALDLLDASGESQTAAAHLALALEELRQRSGNEREN